MPYNFLSKKDSLKYMFENKMTPQDRGNIL